MHATHPNATLTPAGRLKLARLVVDKGWTLARAAERFSVASPPHAAGPTGTGSSGPPAWSTGPRVRTAARTS